MNKNEILEKLNEYENNFNYFCDDVSSDFVIENYKNLDNKNTFEALFQIYANDFNEILENIANEFNKFCKKQVKTTQDFNALTTIELKLKEINGGGNDE